MKEKCDMTDVDVECTSTAHATPLTPEPRKCRNTAQELKEAVNTRRLSETIDKLFRNDGSRQGWSNTKSIKDMMPRIIILKRKCIDKQPSCIVDVVCMPKETNIPRNQYHLLFKLYKQLQLLSTYLTVYP